FPGVFGASGSLSASFPLLMISKMASQPTNPFSDVDPQAALGALSSTVPLFASSDWSSARNDVLASMDAAVSSLNSPSAQERFCSLVLWQRALAQILSLKGYESVDYLSVNAHDGITSTLPPLAEGDTAFKKKSYLGAMVSIKDATNPVLTPDMLGTYSPAQN